MVDALIFRPYPVPHPGGVVTLVSTSHDNSFDDFSYREYLDIREQDQELRRRDRQRRHSRRSASAPNPGPRRASRAECWCPATTSVCSASSRSWGAAFATTKTRSPGRDAVVVLGPDFWKHEFASDPAVVGRTIRLNGTDFTVIGVAPETFPGMQIFSAPRLLHAAGDGAGVLDQSAEELLRGPRRSRAECEGAAEARHDACSRRGASWPCSRRTSSASIRSSIATAARRCARSSKCGPRAMTRTGNSA